MQLSNHVASHNVKTTANPIIHDWPKPKEESKEFFRDPGVNRMQYFEQLEAKYMAWHCLKNLKISLEELDAWRPMVFS